MRTVAAAPLAALVLAGCALRSDVTKLRLQLDQQQVAAARADSARRADLSAIARLVQGVLDSLAVQQTALGSLKGDLRVDLYNIQQQLVAVQELTGQSQQRLTELRAQLEQRSEQIAAQQAAGRQDSAAAAGGGGAPPPAGGAGNPPPPPPSAGAGGAAQPGPDQLMELGLQQLRRGSPATARQAFAEFLKLYPSHARAGDAWFFTGEAWSLDQRSDSASAAYRQVVQRYSNSSHVATALYKLGLLAKAAGRREEARSDFNRIVGSYPLSDEAALARDQLRSLGPATPSKPR